MAICNHSRLADAIVNNRFYSITNTNFIPIDCDTIWTTSDAENILVYFVQPWMHHRINEGLSTRIFIYAPRNTFIRDSKSPMIHLQNIIKQIPGIYMKTICCRDIVEISLAIRSESINLSPSPPCYTIVSPLCLQPQMVAKLENKAPVNPGIFELLKHPYLK